MAPTVAYFPRGTNWKIVGPAIAASGVGSFLLYRDHRSTKRAALSVKANGTAQAAFSW